ncbi:MAG: MFS transporter [Rhizobiales bacterium PAR1]|nr:MAG: MFS transporter [Rhizobiales bacterium PAR1]
MTAETSPFAPRRAAFSVLVVLAITHLLNDTLQSLIPAIYPIIKDAYHLDFGQIGMITLTFQVTASLFQPVVGHYTDKHPMPYSMVFGMMFTLAGLIGLAYAGNYPMLLVSAACVGVGSSIFHPEATRMARHASAGQLGLGQGIFQVGGQAGGAIGPLLAAFIIVPRGQGSLSGFAGLALLAIILMIWVNRRYAALGLGQTTARRAADGAIPSPAGSTGKVIFAMSILIILLFSKNAYAQSFSSFYTFYLIQKFGVTVQNSQLMLFLFLGSAAVGTLGGGILGDKIGRNKIILFSIVGALPFALALPYADLFWTGALTIIINLIMSSAFAAIMIYAMELVPGRVGMIGGLFYGLTFGLGGLAAALLGQIADHTSIETVYRMCSFLPAIGLLAIFLPKVKSS